MKYDCAGQQLLMNTIHTFGKLSRKKEKGETYQ